MEKNRASVVAMNAEIRRTKARLMEQVLALQKLAVKKVALLFELRAFMFHEMLEEEL